MFADPQRAKLLKNLEVIGFVSQFFFAARSLAPRECRRVANGATHDVLKLPFPSDHLSEKRRPQFARADEHSMLQEYFPDRERPPGGAAPIPPRARLHQPSSLG
jgi:hypothetical protein